MKPNWQNVAIVIGVVGGIISLPTSIIDGWHKIFIRPNLEVWKSAPVSISYDQKLKLLGCSFGVLLHNSGNKAEVIHSLRAYLGVPADSSRRVRFSENEIVLKEGE